jgi:myo-inositol-1(or 4)-monophosphatase
VSAAPTRIESDVAADLALAIEVAKRAGALLVERIERVERIDYKSAKDVVTEVDHLSEQLIIDAIRAVHPGDGIIGEESGEHATRSGHAPTAGVEAGQPVVGVIHDPIRGETFGAARGEPARLDGTPIAASDKERLSDFVVSMALSGPALISRARAVRKAIRVPRSMGSAALALAYVANGRFDAFVQQGGLSVWDVAAAGLIAERAGATVTNLAGEPWFDLSGKPRSIGILAAPAAHHAALLRLIHRNGN